jgi:hypothetical protein
MRARISGKSDGGIVALIAFSNLLMLQIFNINIHLAFMHEKRSCSCVVPRRVKNKTRSKK